MSINLCSIKILMFWSVSSVNIKFNKLHLKYLLTPLCMLFTAVSNICWYKTEHDRKAGQLLYQSSEVFLTNTTRMSRVLYGQGRGYRHLLITPWSQEIDDMIAATAELMH